MSVHLHFEPTSGIAGDMAVAALVDAGVPATVVQRAIAAMGVRGLRAVFGRRTRGAYVGRSFDVSWPGHAPKPRRPKPAAPPHAHAHAHEHAHEHEHELEHAHAHAHAHAHRTYADIKRLLARARLDADVRALAGDIFARIAEVEGPLHGKKIGQVTFHEVGAYDSIADVVGVAAAIVHLAPASIGSLPPVVGTGVVRTAHGPVPVPAPATAALLSGVPIVPEGRGELTTPTGAAILAAVVDRFGPLPPMRLRAIGYGAGTRELSDRANVLRVTLGDLVGEPDVAAATDVVLIEANVDDMNPQLVGPLFDALFEAGAVDVWSTPIMMKKGRPALQISALAPAATGAAVERAFFAASTTLGLRRRALDRVVLARSFAKVATPYGEVRVKVAALDGQVLGAQPEFEDCRRLATRAGVPAREVLSAAAAAARQLLPRPARSRRT
ncbi:MAG: nickel pincer cofactor biosynthesis protein LarC [Polyangia bacterium]